MTEQAKKGMSRETKATLLIFVVTFIVGYVMTLFIPDEMMSYPLLSGFFFTSFLIRLVGIRVIIAIAIATAVTLLIRIVDTQEKTSKVSTAKKLVHKKETK